MDTRVEVKQRKQEDAELDITPMIDVVFLLLAFFVVVSKMDPKPAVDLPIARYGKPVNEKEAISLIVRSTGTLESPVIVYGRIQNNVELSLDPEEQNQQITDFVAEEFAKKPNLTGVIIKTESGVKYQNTNRVFSAIKKAFDEGGIEKPVLVAVEEPQ
ncbi:biopolymer transporter ExbD [bacterium]|jgi:biopolymer transport protein ExbD|nr:biopolymer transporter ExbD [Pirellulaceae bacterium]MDB4724338.1 biopolymer transporter ExbD [bacterium]